MQKTVEDIKKEFDEKILILGNKISFIFLLINYISLASNVLLVGKIVNVDPNVAYKAFFISTVHMVVIIIINFVYKWKSKHAKYICNVLPMILVLYMLCKYGDPDHLFFLMASVAISIVFLDEKFTLCIGLLALASIMCLATYKYFVFQNGTILYYIWGYYYSFSMIAILLILFYISCKLVRNNLINKQIGEYEIEKTKKDTALAGRIQDGFLDREFPTNDVYDINACMKPSKDVGGDFYDFYMIDNTRLAMIVADVSGKGIPASLFMANAKTVIRDSILYGVSFEKSIETANRTIFHENKEMQFITFFICVVDLVTGKMNYINAGHVKPYVIDKNGNVNIISSKPDFIFGVRNDTRYHSNEYDLNPGDKLFICTDGVTERLDVNNKLYGTERLKDTLAKNSKNNASDVITSVLNSLNEYGKGKEQNDDITCLLFNFKKNMILEPAVEKEFVISENTVSEIFDFIKDVLNTKGVPEKTTRLMIVASDEIVSNVCKYAYDDAAIDRKIVVSIQIYNNTINIYYTDFGKYFNPLSKITLSGTTKVTDKSKIGGLGIQLTWNIMDKVTYNRIDNKNIILIEKEY